MTRAALLLALAAPALGQSPFTTGSAVTYSIAYLDIQPGGGGNHNGEIEPGEGALLTISVSFSNQNTTASWTPPSPAPGSGTIRGFGYGFIDLNGTGGAAGTWDVDPNHGYGVTPPWNITGSIGNGTPLSGGAQLTEIQFGQFPASNAAIITTNPVNGIYSALWMPSSYTSRWVDFTIAPSIAATGGAASAVFFQTVTAFPAVPNCPSIFATIRVPVGAIPTPSALALLAGGIGARARRR